RQLELRRQDPVAGLVVEQRVEAADLDRHAERPELVLVPLERTLERAVAQVVIPLDRLPDPALRHEPTGDEQADREVENPLRLARCHPGRFPDSPVAPVLGPPGTLPADRESAPSLK